MGNLCGGGRSQDALLDAVKRKYGVTGQSHVLDDYAQLADKEKKKLVEDLDSFDPAVITKLYKDLVEQGGEQPAE